MAPRRNFPSTLSSSSKPSPKRTKRPAGIDVNGLRESAKNIFEGVRIVMVRMGEDMGTKRVSLLERQVENNGGDLLQKLCADKLPTHIVVSAKFEWSPKSLCSYLQKHFTAEKSLCESILKKSAVVTVEWLTQCLRSDRLVEERPFKKDDDTFASPPHFETDETTQPLSHLTHTPTQQTTECLPISQTGLHRPTTQTAQLSATQTTHEERCSQTAPRVDSASLCANTFVSQVSETDKTPGLSDHSKSLIEASAWQQRVLSQKHRYACQKTEADPKTNYNQELTNHFMKLHDHAVAQKDHWREVAYRKAANIISSLPCCIKTEADLDSHECKPLGEKTREKIKEFLETGEIKRVEYLQNDEKLKATTLFTKIWGVGAATAERLFALGCRSIDDVRNLSHSNNVLKPTQLVGLKYFEELDERMPNEEVTQIFEKVKQECETLYPHMLELTCCGSYRRLKETCGDIDVLISRYDDRRPFFELYKIVTELHNCGILTDDLTTVKVPAATSLDESLSQDDEKAVLSYMGVCQLNPEAKHRRIDIKMYPRCSYAFAILYFTGSDYFNRSMRLFAHKLGYSLTDRHLLPVVRARGVKFKAGAPIPCSSEREIFETLGLEYREPKDREVDADWIKLTK